MVEIGDTIRATQVEGGGFVQRDGLDLAEHPGGTGLIVTDIGVDDADGFEQVERPHAGDLRGGVGLV